MTPQELAAAAAKRKQSTAIDPVALARMAAQRKAQMAQDVQSQNAGAVPVPPNLAEGVAAGLQGNAPAPQPQGNAYLGGVLPSPGQAWQNLKENVVGDNDPATLNRGEKFAALLNKGGESMTMGAVGDETGAAVDSLIGRGDYETRRDFYRQQERDLDEQAPVASLAASIGGAVIGPGKLAAPFRGVKGAAAAAGASGAVEGFLEGEGGVAERAQEGAISGTVGMFTGGLLGGLAKGSSSVTRKLFGRVDERPTIEALRAAKSSAYNDVRRSGVKFTGDEMSGLSRRLERLSKTARWDVDKDLDEGAVRVLNAFQRRAGKDITLNNLDKTRQRLWDVYRKTDEPFVLEAIGELDGLISKKAAGNELMQTARAANSKYAKAQLLENAFRKARLQTASTGSGGNILNKYRQAVTRIVTNPNEARWFSAKEIELMESFIEGKGTENLLRRVGKIGPGGNGLMTTLNLYAAVMEPTMLLASGVGAGAKAAADRSAMKGSEEILDVLATGAARQAVPGAQVGRAAVGAGQAVNELRR